VVVGVAGHSGSGKTTFAKLLAHQMRGTLISQDDFYHGRDVMLAAGESAENFDSLAAIDYSLLASILDQVQHSNIHIVRVPNYDFIRQSRDGFKSVEVRDPIIVEGHLVFTSPEVTDHVDFLVYMDANREIARERRLSRDIRERGYSAIGSKVYYEKYVLPQLDSIEEIRIWADLIVDSNNTVDDTKLEIPGIVEILKSKFLDSAFENGSYE